MMQHGHDAEGGWCYHLEDIYRRTFCFLVANLTVDLLFVDEQVCLSTNISVIAFDTLSMTNTSEVIRSVSRRGFLR